MGRGFDVVVVTSISSTWFNATGIDNGDDETDSFDGAGHSVEENLSLAAGHSSDPKVWLTESAFASARGSLTVDAICNYCYGVVTDTGYIRHEKISRREYECYFNEDSIIKRFVCTPGDAEYITCEDGTTVLTRSCDYLHGWIDDIADCVNCDPDKTPSRYRTCADGSKVGTHMCVGGVWVPMDNRCPEDPDPDPCEGVVCEPDWECDGVDKYSRKCVDGACAKGELMETNSAECGYTEPYEPECYDGELRGDTVCPDGQTVFDEICRDNEWVPTGDRCPEAEEEEPFVCTDGYLRGGIVCPDGQTVFDEICRDNEWVPTGDRCPEAEEEEPFVCTDGYLRGGIVCPRGQVINTEICRDNKWVLTGDKCPEEEEEEEEEPEPDKIPWDMIALAGVALILFYFLAMRRSS